MDEELWRDWPQDPRIKVSNKGNVISYKSGTGRPLKASHNNWGYQMVSAGYHGYPQYVHRMVADTWIPNPNRYEQINHIDGDKDNNSVENLEWVTHSQNMRHAYRTGLREPAGGRKRIPIRIVETGEIFESISECARQIGGDKGTIANCLAGKRSTHLGYHFEYV